MNKILILLLCIILTGINLAQEPKWMVYPSLGIDMGGAIPIPLSLIPDETKGTPKLTPNLGLGAQYSLNEKWSFGLDINYHQLSFTANATVISQAFYTYSDPNPLYFSGETHTNVELRFVEFPFTTLYKLNGNWTLLFGAYYSRILEGKFETQAMNGYSSIYKIDTDIAQLPGPVNKYYSFSEDLDNFDAGILFGYQYNITPRILFWGRMHIGMKSVFTPEFQSIDYDMYQLRLSTGISCILFNG